MKLCDVTQFFSPKSGGVRRYLLEKRRYVAEHTEDEHHLIVPGARTGHTREGRLHTFTVASPQVNRTSRYRVLLNTPVVREYLRHARPDIIEAGDPYHLAWSALRAGRELHIPVVGFYHSHFPDAYLRTVLKYCGPFVGTWVLAYAQDYIVRLYSQFAATLVPSDSLRDLLDGWGVPNAVSVKLGVDTGAFRPGPRGPEVRARFGIPEDAFLLLYVGRLAGEKNIVTLLEAFRKLHAAGGRKWWLLVVGDGPLRRLLPAVREETGALQWHSFVNGERRLGPLLPGGRPVRPPGRRRDVRPRGAGEPGGGAPRRRHPGQQHGREHHGGAGVLGAAEHAGRAGRRHRAGRRRRPEGVGGPGLGARRGPVLLAAVLGGLWEQYRAAIERNKGWQVGR